MLDTPRSELAWEYWLPIPFASFPFTSPPVLHRVPPGSERALQRSPTMCVCVCVCVLLSMIRCNSNLHLQRVGRKRSEWERKKEKRKFRLPERCPTSPEPGRFQACPNCCNCSTWLSRFYYAGRCRGHLTLEAACHVTHAPLRIYYISRLNGYLLTSWSRVLLNTFAASYLNTQGLNNSCLKSPASTIVDLTFQSRALRSFSFNQLRNLSL